jgi:hypothetical protein
MEQENPKYIPIKVYSTINQQDLVFAKMALEREGIRYETQNENFSALYPGTSPLATVDVLVDQSDVERAGEILKPIIEGKKEK